MKTRTTRSRSSKPKAKQVPKTVDQYVAGVPEQARSAFEQLRSTIQAVMPADATETISYGIPAFKRDRVLVWLGGFSNHCSLFPTAAVIEKFKDELKGFSTSKGTIHFPLEKPLPAPLIRKIVKARVAATASKSKR